MKIECAKSIIKKEYEYELTKAEKFDDFIGGILEFFRYYSDILFSNIPDLFIRWLVFLLMLAIPAFFFTIAKAKVCNPFIAIPFSIMSVITVIMYPAFYIYIGMGFELKPYLMLFSIVSFFSGLKVYGIAREMDVKGL